MRFCELFFLSGKQVFTSFPSICNLGYAALVLFPDPQSHYLSKIIIVFISG